MPSLPVDRSSLQAGDHIYCHRFMYTHHGIYVGDGMVIHLTKTKPRRRRGRACQTCGYDRDRHSGGVVKVCLDCFLKGKNVYRFEYGVSKTRFAAKRKGTCATSLPQFEHNEVVQRAFEVLQNGFDEYDIIDHNCECFASYCTVGAQKSVQSKFGIVKVSTGLAALALAPISVFPIAAWAYLILRKRI